MQKKVTVMALIAVAAIILAMPVMAQTTTESVSPLTSNTKTSTAAIFTNDVDNFIDYHKYSTVLSDDAQWFGLVTGRNDDDVGGLADLGYARNFGGIYLGAWYRGNIYRQTGNSEIRTITPNWDDDRQELDSKTETTFYSSKWHESTNQIQFLIGVKGHAIKVGFFESLASNQNAGVPGVYATVTDYLDGRKEYENATASYEVSYGWLRPYLGWGSSFTVAGMNLMPYIDVGFGIYNEKQTDNRRNYTQINGVRQNVEDTVYHGYNNGYLQPSGTVGAKLDLAKKDTVQTQLQLSYGISMKLYNNDYGATGLSGSVAGTVSWNESGGTQVNKKTVWPDRTVTETELELTIIEKSSMNHTITPGYKITGEPAENFKLGFLATVPITFGSSSSNEYTKTIAKYAIKYNWDNPGYVNEKETITYLTNTETSTLNVTVQLHLGASYKLIPDRFTVNAGIKATPISYKHKETTTLPGSVSSISTSKTTEDDGSVTENTKNVDMAGNTPDKVDTNNTWDSWTATLGGGFTFNFNSKVALDMGVVVDTKNTDTFNLDVSNINVIFTFKF